MSERELIYADVVRAAEARDPTLADLVVRYLEQPDPPEDRPEDGDETSAISISPDAWTLAKLRAATNPKALEHRLDDERKAVRAAAWQGIEASRFAPPRLQLWAVLEEIYDRGDEPGRSALIEIFKRARLAWGLWKGFKRIYKKVEASHDAPMFGVLAFRLDFGGPRAASEVGHATTAYLQRRAWRYLRHLGQAVPDLYPLFAIEVLKHFPEQHPLGGSWIANHVWAAGQLKGLRHAWVHAPPADLGMRAFPEAWKRSPDPLLRLLEDAQHDSVCDFAIRSLRADFPAALRRTDAAWLARLGAKRAGSVHEFLIELLSANPELHQSKLAALGLYDMVVGLLASPNAKARRYAIDYAQAHAPNIAALDLIGYAAAGAAEVQAFVRARLEKLDPRALGLPLIVRMSAISGFDGLAAEMLARAFAPGDIDEATYVALAGGTRAQRLMIKAFYEAKNARPPAGHLRARLALPHTLNSADRTQLMRALGAHPPHQIGLAWMKEALLDPALGPFVAEWLKAGMLKGDELDVEWIKGVVMRPALRATALAVLGNREIVAPARIGLPWLLAMARNADAELSGFAQRMLLEHFAPADFAGPGADPALGIEKLFALAAGASEPVRVFASTYLRVHHPEIGPQTAEARSYGVEPRLSHDVYSAARIEPLLFDERADVRRFACAIAERELVRWDARTILWRMAESRHREPRKLAAELLLAIGDPKKAEPHVPPLQWLAGPQVFALAEAPHKSSRELALTLIGRHYALLGGPSRLGWLMESAEREVRLWAVRLLWQKHRPRETPAGWKPRKGDAADEAAPLEAQEDLRMFLRTILFSLPPGRMERRDAEGALPDRALPASVAKRRLIEVVRDLALEDRAFAALVAPILGEMSGSRAKTEWQGCVAALARIRSRHGDLRVALPEARP